VVEIAKRTHTILSGVPGLAMGGVGVVMATIMPHENGLSEEKRVEVKNRENEANQLYQRCHEQRSQGIVVLTIAPSDNDPREETPIGIENGENEANKLYRPFRARRSAGFERSRRW
jgi:hypothetical protein